MISLVITVKLICVFAFAYAKKRFSHDAAHISPCQLPRFCRHITPFLDTGTNLFFSSPEPSGSKCELIVYPYTMASGSVGVVCSQCSNICSSDTAWPMKAKFHVEPVWEGGTKVYISGPGHMTKMTAMTIYDKNL